MKAKKAFTLVEVLLVVLILAVLASIAVPRIAESSLNSKRAQCDSNRTNLIGALERYALDNDGDFPDGQGNFEKDVRDSATYFPHGPPVCPFGNPYIAYAFDNTLKTVEPHSH